MRICRIVFELWTKIVSGGQKNCAYLKNTSLGVKKNIKIKYQYCHSGSKRQNLEVLHGQSLRDFELSKLQNTILVYSYWSVLKLILCGFVFVKTGVLVWECRPCIMEGTYIEQLKCW